MSIALKEKKVMVVDMGEMGVCNIPCRTIARACEDILEEADVTEFSPLLQKDQSLPYLTEWLCESETSACVKKVPSVPKDWEPSSIFEAMIDEEVKSYRELRTSATKLLDRSLDHDRDAVIKQMKTMKEQMGNVFPKELELELMHMEKAAAAEGKQKKDEL
eukprot:gene650-2085_t